MKKTLSLCFHIYIVHMYRLYSSVMAIILTKNPFSKILKTIQKDLNMQTIYLVRIPDESDRDSGGMPTAVPI